MGVDELAELLKGKGFHEQVVTAFVSNRISGSLLLNEDVKDLAPVLGDKILIRKLLTKCGGITTVRWN